MGIHRGQLSADGYTHIPNHWTRDPGLSWKAKGLLAYIAGHSVNYELTVAQIIAEGTDGKDSVLAGIAELVTAGYLTRVRTRNTDGSLGPYDYTLTENPSQSGESARSKDKPAGQDSSLGRKTRTTACAPGRKSRTGAEQGKQDVSAGGNQSGFTTVVNPPTKKTISKKTKEDQEMASDKSSASEINAGSVVADWIDYCGGKGVKLTGQAIARYGKKIKELLSEGFDAKLIKHALARMLERGQASRPGLLDSFVIEVQGLPVPVSPAAPREQFKSAAEKKAEQNEREAVKARIGDALIAKRREEDPGFMLSRLPWSQQRKFLDLVEQIYTNEMASRNGVGYAGPVVIDAEVLSSFTPPREVTA